MIRNLLIITGVGLLLAVVGIGGALALGGRDLARHEWTWVVTDDRAGDSDFRFQRGRVGPDVTRTLAWDGGERLSVDMPAEVTFVQGDEAGVHITGPQTVVGRVRLEDGRLTLDDDEDVERGYIRWNANGIRVWSETEALRVTVTAPDVRAFELVGSGDLSIRDYDQPAMELTLHGSGDIDARGRTDLLGLTVNGSGDVDLDQLIATDAVITVRGSGDVIAGPTGAVRVDVGGSGDVTLTRRPDRLNQTVDGPGDVEID
ncbi:MAG: hypothetical protein A2623_11590 [Caulobacterales bacterium RIFCSPHIGHO2_01_FULL_70_19]|jgi:hypothetical protein|nr:MAG: hypothetical protein A2623_11590 [Caulobacterales bacterium RIFCSPHIGHO2_01_FULL_70_19]